MTVGLGSVLLLNVNPDDSCAYLEMCMTLTMLSSATFALNTISRLLCAVVEREHGRRIEVNFRKILSGPFKVLCRGMLDSSIVLCHVGITYPSK